MRRKEAIALKEKLLEELKALEQEGVGYPFVFTASEAYFLLCGIQVALGHPQMRHNPPNELSARWLKSLAEDLQDRLCKTPALARVAELGWDWQRKTVVQ